MPMRELKIPAGTPLLIGPPARPMDREISISIGKLTDSIDGIVEAHLPQVFAIDVMEEPTQVLVIVLGQNADLKEVIDQLGSVLTQILPEGMHLDVWPVMISHSMLYDVRGTGCQV